MVKLDRPYMDGSHEAEKDYYGVKYLTPVSEISRHVEYFRSGSDGKLTAETKRF